MEGGPAIMSVLDEVFFLRKICSRNLGRQREIMSEYFTLIFYHNSFLMKYFTQKLPLTCS